MVSAIEADDSIVGDARATGAYGPPATFHEAHWPLRSGNWRELERAVSSPEQG
jgi:hypothetical protein